MGLRRHSVVSNLSSRALHLNVVPPVHGPGAGPAEAQVVPALIRTHRLHLIKTGLAFRAVQTSQGPPVPAAEILRPQPGPLLHTLGGSAGIGAGDQRRGDRQNQSGCERRRPRACRQQRDALLHGLAAKHEIRGNAEQVGERPFSGRQGDQRPAVVKPRFFSQPLHRRLVAGQLAVALGQIGGQKHKGIDPVRADQHAAQRSPHRIQVAGMARLMDQNMFHLLRFRLQIFGQINGLLAQKHHQTRRPQIRRAVDRQMGNSVDCAPAAHPGPPKSGREMKIHPQNPHQQHRAPGQPDRQKHQLPVHPHQLLGQRTGIDVSPDPAGENIVHKRLHFRACNHLIVQAVHRVHHAEGASQRFQPPVRGVKQRHQKAQRRQSPHGVHNPGANPPAKQQAASADSRNQRG